MSYIDPNSIEFKLGVKIGRIIRTVVIYTGVGALGYLLGRNTNRSKGYNKLNNGYKN